MRLLRKTNSPSRRCFQYFCIAAGIGVLTLLEVLSVSQAKEITPANAAGPPCAVIKNYAGEVQILNSDRSHIVETSLLSVPCGGWIYVMRGYVQLTHRDGFKVQVGSGTFLQATDPVTDAKGLGDHFVLYKGEIYLSSESGVGEARVSTANARLRVDQGSAIVEYIKDTEDTQLINIDARASIENRFESTRRIEVGSGEASLLNFRLLRVVPSAPVAVAVAALRPRLEDLHLSDKLQSQALAVAQARAARKFASDLHVSKKQLSHANPADEDEKDTGRRPASEKLKSQKKTRENYLRNALDEKAAMLKAHFVNRMVAGQQAGEKMLYPDKFYGRPQQVHVEVIDPAEKLLKKKQKIEDSEKRRLIEELSKIREE